MALQTVGHNRTLLKYVRHHFLNVCCAVEQIRKVNRFLCNLVLPTETFHIQHVSF